jgi:hypothetical protein
MTSLQNKIVERWNIFIKNVKREIIDMKSFSRRLNTSWFIWQKIIEDSTYKSNCALKKFKRRVKMMILEQSRRRRTLFLRVYLAKSSIYEKLFCFYRWNLFFLFLCVRSIFHHLMINIRVHSRFYREIDKSVKSSIWWWDCVLW